MGRICVVWPGYRRTRARAAVCLLALAVIYDGGKRKDAARIGDVGLQVVRDWVLRFNAKGPEGLIDDKSTGQPTKLNDDQRQALAALVEAGPIPAIHGVVRIPPVIGKYLTFYNSKRPHSSLDRQTLDQAYFNALQPIPAAA